MGLSAFMDEENAPDREGLSEVLGVAMICWDDLRAYLAEKYDPLEEIWKFGGAKYGWTLRMIHKKRTILYMTPVKGEVLVGFVLGEKAVKIARELGVDPDVMEIVEEAPRYAEGRGVRIGVRSKADLQGIKKLAEAKMA
ncbi:MAG TPA: DUF3788 domain-containing protein [Candidatus Krumholzibacterium sp.]|nr:DUF3788 domain-containing protein [Candidatus Krumholzibacterium sp.]